MNKSKGTTISISYQHPETLDKEGFDALEWNEIKGEEWVEVDGGELVSGKLINAEENSDYPLYQFDYNGHTLYARKSNGVHHER